MKARFLILGGAVLATALTLRAAPGGDPPAKTQGGKAEEVTFAKNIQPFLAKHCLECHNDKKKRAGLTLEKFKDDESVQKNRKLWETLQHMLQSGEMPPPERPRPAAGEVDKALAAINAVLNRLDCTKPQNVGRVTLRRLNRSEYNNTIRDLVGVDFKPAEDFPADDTGYGFDNIGDVLSVSPLLLEKYLAAAETILDRAITIVDPPKPSKARLQGLRVSKGAGETPPKASPFLNARGDVFGITTPEEGDYFIRAEVAAQHAGSEPVRGALRLGQTDLKTFEIAPGKTAAIVVEGKARLSGSSRVAVAFLNPHTEKDPNDPKKETKSRLTVRYIELDGPYNPPPPKLPAIHRKLMDHKPGLAPREAAREIVGRFATKAFRRPVPPEEVERLLGLYDQAAKRGVRFENAVRLALYRVLVSPHFLYRVELDPPGAEPGKAYPVSEHALASRLSYFLWSSMPDEELFALASAGRLRDNLEEQVRRMLKDPKSSAFVENFAGQWLTLRNLDTVAPDPKVFPGFNNELRAAMRRETELFFDAVLRENRSVLDFLDADYSFLNERLAKHYGIDGVKGSNFRKVKVPPTRGGVLTHASILTLTSYPTRTSPVQRGKWVLEQLLNTPPPPAPDDVPELDGQKQLKGSLRVRMEEHRKNPGCASCHQRMDPIGFGLENFDAIGRWRDKDEGFAIDPAGVLPDGKAFKGPAELRMVLKDGRRDLFCRCLIEKVLTYGLGRGVEYYDRCAIDRILEVMAKDDYRFSTLLVEVAKSEPFQKRTATVTKGGKR